MTLRDVADIPHPAAIDAERCGRPLSGWRLRWFTVIFEADTRAGRAFDIALIVAILASVAVVMLEYLARLACVRHPGRCARSVFGS